MKRTVSEKQKESTARMILMAKWVKFFDEAGIEWELDTSKPTNLAVAKNDFWLPSFDGGTFVIVKDKALTEQELGAAKRLCAGYALNVWLAVGPPDFRVYEFYTYSDSDGRVSLINGIPNADEAHDENRMFVLPGYEQPDGSIKRSDFDMLGNVFIRAVEASRNLR